MNGLFEGIQPEQLALLSTVIALALAEGLDTDEINVLGNLLVAVGSIMTTIAAQQVLLSKCAGSQDNSSNSSKNGTDQR